MKYRGCYSSLRVQVPSHHKLHGNLYRLLIIAVIVIRVTVVITVVIVFIAIIQKHHQHHKEQRRGGMDLQGLFATVRAQAVLPTTCGCLRERGGVDWYSSPWKTLNPKP